MNLRKVCKQLVTHRPIESYKDAGEPQYGETRQIKARYSPDSGKKRSATGELIDVESTCITMEPVSVGELIEGAEVQRVKIKIGKSGRVIGYWSYL